MGNSLSKAVIQVESRIKMCIQRESGHFNALKVCNKHKPKEFWREYKSSSMQYLTMAYQERALIGGRLPPLAFCAASCLVLLNVWWVSLPDKIPG